MSISIISWNVNGTKNVECFPHALKLVNSKAIVFLQETFELEGGKSFCPKKFVRFGVYARQTGGRPSGGLSTLISREFLAHAEIRRVESPIPHLLPIYIKKEGFEPIILG